MNREYFDVVCEEFEERCAAADVENEEELSPEDLEWIRAEACGDRMREERE
jgi:hypothetical protein